MGFKVVLVESSTKILVMPDLGQVLVLQNFFVSNSIKFVRFGLNPNS